MPQLRQSTGMIQIRFITGIDGASKDTTLITLIKVTQTTATYLYVREKVADIGTPLIDFLH